MAAWREINASPSSPISVSLISTNLRHLRERIARACEPNDRLPEGRDPALVRLVAVTKSVGDEEIAALYEAGVRDFGESRPQQLCTRRAAFEARFGSATGARWHLIGPLQTNKVRRTLPQIDLLHALDRTRLIKSVSREAALRGVPADVLVQLNVSGEDQKHGFAETDLGEALAATANDPNLRVRGLMCMAPYDAPPTTVRGIFARLREMREDPSFSRYLVGRELSMGMSGDFELAVEEGATLVRIGRALFQGN